MAIMGGNWEPLEKVQKVIREYIYQALEGDVSPPRLEQYSRSILQSIRASLDEKNLPDVSFRCSDVTSFSDISIGS